MSASLHTLSDIFDKEFENNGELVRLKKIVIPIIQRDYAQGRKGAAIKRVRTRFLAALYRAVVSDPITLDFVYGDIDADGVMTPLDGQQRLTTLFLLYWYGARKGKVDPSECGFLANFSYETRYSARDFCDYLVKYKPEFTGTLSEEIRNCSWFPLDWEKDPTIGAMLVMLDCMDQTFGAVPDLWERLKNGAVTFYFLPIKNLGLTDELYIKMNSRGKPLTGFEHFKAELEHELVRVDPDTAGRIVRKIDLDWTDLLWAYRGGDHVTDDIFLRYFHFICDVLCYKSGGTPQGRESDEFSLLTRYFSAGSEGVKEHIEFLEKSFDCWCGVKKQGTIKDFFRERVSEEGHEAGKILADGNGDYLEECLWYYGEVSGNGNRLFTLGETVILYAFLTYLLHKTQISDRNFRRRLRVVRNLVDNSEDEISDSENRVGGNRMPAILKQVDSIILNGRILDHTMTDINFNVYQLSEETEKLEWTKQHPEQAESLYELEDHELLYGQIGIVGLDHPEYFGRFLTLFQECSYDAIDCALMAMGNYMQREKNGWRYQSGSSKNGKAWRSLFHRSASDGFERTKECLRRLLSMTETFTEEYLQTIKEDYLASCEEASAYDWRYYYMKYDEFRPGRYGKYWWDDLEQRPYEFAVLWTERQMSENAYQPFLKAVDTGDNISRDEYVMYLVFDNDYLECENGAWVFRDNETDDEVHRIPVAQTEEGMDTEDRIWRYLSL